MSEQQAASARKRSGATSKGLNTSKDSGKFLSESGFVVLTACIRLELDAAAVIKLRKTHELYTRACNFLVPYVTRDPQERNWQRFNLHKAAYGELRQQVPELGSQLACNCVRSVSAAYKTEFANHPRKDSQEAIKTIAFKNPSIHLDKNTITYGSDLKTASVYTCEKRVSVTLCPGKHQEKLLSLGEPKEANLVWHPKRGSMPAYWALHLSIEVPCSGLDVDGIKPEEVLGVDVGENNMAAVSSGRLWKAGRIKEKRDRYLSHRRRLQRNGSQSARKHLKRASGREARRVKHENHVVSRQIVNEALSKGVKVIVLEDLKGIRERIKANKRVRSRLHRWPFKELQDLIGYKAQLEGIRVLSVDPRYTSQTCSHCGTIGKRVKHRFDCTTCGLRAHSDLNASRNLQGLGYLLMAQGLV